MQSVSSLQLHSPGRHSLQIALNYPNEALAVQSVPPACDVLVDGELRGQTPLTVRLRRSRKHAIELRKKGYAAKLVHHYPDRPRNTLQMVLEPNPSPQASRRPAHLPRPAPPRRRAAPAPHPAERASSKC